MARSYRINIKCSLELLTNLYGYLSYLLTGAYERRSREGTCNSGSIQIRITYVFLFW